VKQDGRKKILDVDKEADDAGENKGSVLNSQDADSDLDSVCSSCFGGGCVGGFFGGEVR
jgi:hypothetical protein